MLYSFFLIFFFVFSFQVSVWFLTKKKGKKNDEGKKIVFLYIFLLVVVIFGVADDVGVIFLEMFDDIRECKVREEGEGFLLSRATKGLVRERGRLFNMLEKC